MIKRPYIRQGSTPFQELKKAAKSWPGLETFLNNLTNDGTDSEQGARRANFVQLRNEIDDAAHDIYDRLDHYKKRALSEEGNLVYPGLMRSSGDPCSPLHILAINPTFSVDVHSPYGILDPKCPSMGEVVQSGLTSEKCFGTDLFPLRVNIDYLEVTDRPFDGFPEFTDLFLHRHLSSFLEIGGKVLLVFGRSCFKALEDHLKLKSIELDGSNDGLRIYWEEEPSSGFIRRLVIWAPHPRCFRDPEPGFPDLQRYAKRMDEAINLATYLVGIRLDRWSYWSDLVIENFGDLEDSYSEDSDCFYYCT